MPDELPALCQRLDDYLNGDLAFSDRGRFQAHLAECDDCRDAVDQQQWLDGLLRSSEAAAIEAPPAPATIPLRRRVPSRRRFLVAAAAAGIAVAAAAPWSSFLGWEGLGEGRQEVASLPSPEPSEPAIDASPPPPATIADPSPSPSLLAREISDKPLATFASNGNAIAVPLANDDAEVTVVQLVPTVTSQVRRVHLTSALPTANHGG